MNLVPTWLRAASVVAVTLSAGVALAAGAAAACQAPGGAAEMRQQIIGWMNAERGAHGLAPLRDSGSLQRSATSHACDMARAGSMTHQLPGGPSLTQRLRSSGYRFRAANENIAMTSSKSVAQVTSLWAHSPKHLHNVLDPKVREVGVGIALEGGKFYWVTNAGLS